MVALQVRLLGPDHFVKVREIIKDLIAKLEADADAEATAKTACDENMKSAIEKRDKNAADLETAGAEIDSTTAAINGLKEEVAELAADIADLNKHLLEADEMRASDKAQNEKAIADADEGKSAVDQ